jgi:hypothetical protein
MDAYTQLHKYLSEFHPANLEHPDYVVPWWTPAALDHFLTKAVEITPRLILFGVGRPLDCRRNALETAVGLPRVVPWFGFRLSWFDQGPIWWFHAWCVSPTGSIIDSGPEMLGCRYVGIRWSKQFTEKLPKIDWHPKAA